MIGSWWRVNKTQKISSLPFWRSQARRIGFSKTDFKDSIRSPAIRSFIRAQLYVQKVARQDFCNHRSRGV